MSELPLDASGALMLPDATAEDEQDRPRSGAAGLSLRSWRDPWMQRVRDVDDSTLDTLMRQLLKLRGIRRISVTLGMAAGALAFGLLPTRELTALQLFLFYAVLGSAAAVPLFMGSSLAVRLLMLREARRHGLSRTAALLVVTLAERRARKLLPFGQEDPKVKALCEAVRDWENA